MMGGVPGAEDSHGLATLTVAQLRTRCPNILRLLILNGAVSVQRRNITGTGTDVALTSLWGFPLYGIPNY